MTTLFDVAVVGGGMTGLAAAHHAALEGCTVLHVIGGGLPGGLAANVGELEGFPATSPIAALDLALRLTEENQRLGIEVTAEDVARLEVAGQTMRLHTAAGARTARTVVAATGARLAMLDVAGATRLLDKGVSQCAGCNGSLYRGKEVVVVGGGDSALQEALHLVKYAALVTVVTRGEALRARRSLVDRAAAAERLTFRWETDVVEILSDDGGDDGVSAIRLRDRASGAIEDTPCAGVFVYIGLEANTQWLGGQAALDARGFVVTDAATLATSLPGLLRPGPFAAAMGDGSRRRSAKRPRPVWRPRPRFALAPDAPCGRKETCRDAMRRREPRLVAPWPIVGAIARGAGGRTERVDGRGDGGHVIFGRAIDGSAEIWLDKTVVPRPTPAAAGPRPGGVPVMLQQFARVLPALAASLLVGAFSTAAQAQKADQTVKIGAIYPFSGNAASSGTNIKAAMEWTVDVVNNGAPELAAQLPLAKGGGLSGLGGAKVTIEFADNQGTPAAGANQALRLITESKVHALIGAFQSGITVTASAMAEKHGIPFVTPESVAADLTERGFKWFFRVTPVAADFARAYSEFLKEQKAAGRKVDSIALINENTEYGNSVSKVIKEVFAKDGFNITQHIAYSANTTDVQPQVLQLKEKNPDVAIFISYTSDAILYTKTMKDVNWKPAIMIADNAGFNDPSFVKALASQVEGLVNRSSYAAGKPGSVSAIANELLKKKTGNDLDDISARGVQGLLTLLDAINRAGSTDPAKIQAALKATDLPASQMVTGYNGVKFDEKGQNIKASALITQMKGGAYVPVWPKDRAVGEITLPYKGW